jgi:hypothetical protein
MWNNERNAMDIVPFLNFQTLNVKKLAINLYFGIVSIVNDIGYLSSKIVTDAVSFNIHHSK